MAELTFKRDTGFRKGFFVPDSFSHPAKMDAQLLVWIVEHYTKPGDVILDPMFGSGTTMLACTLGRHVIGVELEQKFVEMAKANWEKVRQRPMLGYEMGECIILLGDARNLEGLLADSIITSPPYAEAQIGDDRKTFNPTIQGIKDGKRRGGSLVGKFKGQADAIVTSPPFGDISTSSGLGSVNKDDWGHEGTDIAKRRGLQVGYGNNPSNISNLPYGRIDAILTSPPYEGTNTTGRPDSYNGSHGPHSQVQLQDYRETAANIGNLKADSYLQAMLTVYKSCHAVLKPQGLMILVLKNFIRNQQVVRLDLDTIKLCEQAGFSLIDQHRRRLPSQSFWRIIYQKKFPNVETIDFENVLVFRSGDRALRVPVESGQ